MRKKILKMARKELGKGVDFDKHFVPHYDPWDQRLCLVPNGDFFHAIRDGRASIVTDTIDAFTENGIRLESGEMLEADVIITATGLDLRVLGDVQIFVDNQPIDIAETFSYKSMMFSGVPNLVSTFGYINASWTLKADLTAEYSCRLLNHMSDTGMRQCMPRLQEQEITGKSWIQNFSSGYFQRKCTCCQSRETNPHGPIRRTMRWTRRSSTRTPSTTASCSSPTLSARSEQVTPSVTIYVSENGGRGRSEPPTRGFSAWPVKRFCVSLQQFTGASVALFASQCTKMHS